MVHLLLVSDSHLSPAAPYADDNWAAVVDEVRRRGPDLVVHTGDISLDGANDAGDLEHARRQLDELPVPWRALPGNHDIGDVGAGDDSVTAARRRRYRDAFGAGSWVTVLDGWRIIGVDVQTLASPLDASRELWAWLEGAAVGPEPIAFFLHRPLHPLAAGELDDPGRYVGEPTRSALLDLINRHDVRLIGSGHVHQWRQVDHEGRRHLWAPSTWATLPDAIQPTIGTKTVGVVAIELATVVRTALVRPAGVADVTIAKDFASPYDH